MIYSDASNKGLGCVFMQHRKIIVYTSCQLVAMVLALKIYGHYLYGENTHIYIDHKILKYFFHPKGFEHEIKKMARVGEGLRYIHPIPSQMKT